MVEEDRSLNVVGVIPARMGSSRFPGKPMALIRGIPMIGHVYTQSRQSQLLSDLYVATCDEEIRDYIVSIGGKALMTGSHHPGCVDRCSEALTQIEQRTGQLVDILVIIQGDEPMIQPRMIDQAVEALLIDSKACVVNLAAPIETDEEFEDPNCIKVVTSKKGYALYFSRAAIPYRKKTEEKIVGLKQVCVMPFRRDFLIKFPQFCRTHLEIIESIDMIRALEHGYPVKIVPTAYQTWSVDTPQDLMKVEQLMAP